MERIVAMTKTAGNPIGGAQRTRRNPYVGPESVRYGQALYGRDRETAELLDMLIAQRVVLLYSPSGAGKTSLIQAALRPALERERFEVLPIVRVTHELPPGAAGMQPRNRYVFSTMLSIEDGLPPHLQRPLVELDAMTLPEYFEQLPDLDGRPGNEVLLLDQFEELLTVDPIDRDAKRQFFAELGESLGDRNLWALFSMREDFVAGLDPYRRLLPKRLQSRYRLDLLSVEAATAAMTRPAQAAGVAFTDDAAAKLIDDLRRVRVQRPAGVSEELGPYVEPVQLQVACRRIWDQLAADATEITLDDVEAIGDIDSALADYYADCVATVAARTSVSERALRVWFGQELITPQGFRGQVLEGPEGSESALRDLTAIHVLRAENRHGVTWYELAHDRLIDPVRSDNARWLEANLTAFEREALLWDSQGRPDSLLLTGSELDDEERILLKDPGRASSLDQDYLRACKRLRSEQKRERRTTRRTRRLLVFAIAGLVVALLAFVAAGLSAIDANRQRIAADQQSIAADRSALVGQGFKQLSQDPELALLFAQQATALAGAGALTEQERQLLQAAIVNIPTRRVLGAKGVPTNDASFSGDGSRIALIDDGGRVHVLDATNGAEEASTTPSAKPLAVTAAPEAERVVWLDNEYQIWAWNPTSNAEPEALPVTGVFGAWGVGFSNDGTRLLVADWDEDFNEQLQIFTPTGEALSKPFQRGDEYFIYGAAGSAEGDLVAVAAGTDGVDLWKPYEATSVHLDVRATTVALAENASVLIVGDESSVKAWHVTSQAELWSTPLLNVKTVVLSPDASRIAVGTWDGTVAVLDAADGTVLEVPVRLPTGAPVIRVEFDPLDEGRLLVVDATRAATLWDVRMSDAEATGIAISADGLVATGYDDGSVRVWSTAGDEQMTWAAHDGPVRDLSFVGDEAILTGGDDGTALWDLATTDARAVEANEFEIQAVAASPDEQMFAAAGYDADGGDVVRIWNANGELACEPPDELDWPAVRIAFDESSRQLMAATWNGVTVYDVDSCSISSSKETHRDLDLYDASFDDSGQVVATLNASRDRVEVHPLDSDSPPHDKWDTYLSNVRAIGLSADGRTLAAAVGYSGVILLDAVTGERLQAYQSAGDVVDVVIAGSDRLVAVSSDRSAPLVVPISDDALRESAAQLSSHELTSEECSRLLPHELCEGWIRDNG